MDTSVADERVLMFKEQLTADEAEKVAWSKKVDAFGAINKAASFFSRPREEDFELIYSEHRYEPLWFVKAGAKYVYDRTTSYQLPTSGAEVQTIDIEGKTYDVVAGHITVKGVDHCVQEEEVEVVTDGISGDKSSALKKYLTYSSKVVENIEKLSSEKSIMVPPQVRVSAIVRETLAGLMKVIQADKIFEEKIEVTAVDLYYRPVFAYQFRWLSKNKEAIVEIDGLTGEVSFGRNLFKEYVGKALETDFLFDLGADAAGMIIPGGSIAVKVAKQVIDRRKK